MQTMIREVMLDALGAIPALTDRYVGNDPAYVTAVSAWLARTEAALAPLRHPATGFVAARRGLLAAVDDGYRPPELTDDARRRRVRRATAATIAGEVEARLDAEVARVDELLADLRDRMAQLIAVAAQHVELPAPDGDREAWLLRVWHALDAGNGTQAMVGYLSARLTRTDRLYLLDELLRNVFDDT